MDSEIKKSIKSSRAFLKNVSDNELEILMQEFDNYAVKEIIFNTVNQEYYIMKCLDKVSKYFYEKGFEEGAKTAADDISSKI